MATTVAVFFQQPGIHAYPLHTEPYRQRFAELAREVERLGAQFRVVREQSCYVGNGLFKRGWKYAYGRLVPAGPVRGSVIFDKGYFVSDDSVPVFNPTALSHLCTDKYLTATTFPDDSPHTLYIASEAEFQAAIQHQPDRLKVVKPLDGLGGEGVYIGTASELQTIDRQYPCLLQEFLDTSGGIADITKSHHDLRIAILNGNIVYVLVRTPPPGQLVASAGLGAHIRAIDRHRLPTTALDLVGRVERQMSAYTQRFYSIDLAFVNGQPKIIELNSRVGLGD
ncbi:MAG: ATP-grasp domain-containing protein, partial [Cyanobacteria bacterium J06555_12]